MVRHEISDNRFDRRLAVSAEALFLANLILLPVLSFLLLVYLYRRYARDSHVAPIARQHLKQSVFASIWAGILLIVVPALLLAIFGYQSPSVWVAVILYFVTVHAALILLGALALVKASSHQHYRYPIIGPAN